MNKGGNSDTTKMLVEHSGAGGVGGGVTGGLASSIGAGRRA